MESQITTNFWGQDSDKAFRYLYDKYASTLRYFSAKYVDDDVLVENLRNSYLAPTELEPIFSRKNNLLIIAPSTITAATAVYYKAITDLSADADLTTIPENYEEFIYRF